MTRVLVYNSKLPNSNFHLAISLLDALRATTDVAAEIANGPETLGLRLRSFAPDVVLAFGGEEIRPEVLEVQKTDAPAAKWVLWTTEDPFELARNQKIAPQFDVVLTSDQASVAEYAGHPSCHWLPLAGSPLFSFRPVRSDAEMLYDLLFVGTAWPNRAEFLKTLISGLRAEDFSFRFILPTNPHIPTKTLDALDLLPFERDFRLSPQDLATLQNRSRFTLTLLRDYSGTGPSRPQSSPTNRFYETALAGTAQILVSKEVRIARFYPEVGDSVFTAETAEQVLAILRASRTDPSARQYAARTLQDFVRENHLYTNRVAELLRLI